MEDELERGSRGSTDNENVPLTNYHDDEPRGTKISSCPWFFADKNRRPWILMGILALILAVVIVWASVSASSDDDGGDDGCNCGGDDFPNVNNHPDPTQPVNATIGAVATDNPVCSEMGVGVLKVGGNSVDSAITTVLCLGLLNPFASGVGGGAIFVIRTPDGEISVIDSREVAPSAASTDMYENATSGSSLIGGLAVAVPGELKGLETVWKKFGTIKWKELVEPVALLARNFTVGAELDKKLKANEVYIMNSPSLKEIYAPEGVLLKEGDFCYQPTFSETLMAVANQGTDAFYFGDVAKNIAEDIQAAGGIVTEQDINNYQIEEREAITTWYHGYKIISAPPPFGGVLVSMVLNILEGYGFSNLGWTSTYFPQYLAEALKFAYDDRMALGDPKFVDITDIVDTMMDKDHASQLRNKISKDKSHELTYYEDLYPLTDQAHNDGTSHISIVDGQRMACSITTTINTAFGAKFISTKTGVLLNNEMDDFAIPGEVSVYGVPPSPANYIKPGKRPLSSMSPTIVLKNDKLFMVVGASGGTMIPTATLQASINVLDFGFNPYDAVAAARIHEQLIPPQLYYEEDYPEDKLQALENAEQILSQSGPQANSQCITVLEDGSLQAGSDWRKQGRAAGY